VVGVEEDILVNQVVQVLVERVEVEQVLMPLLLEQQEQLIQEVEVVEDLGIHLMYQEVPADRVLLLLELQEMLKFQQHQELIQ
jgi:hypothetical protein